MERRKSNKSLAVILILTVAFSSLALSGARVAFAQQSSAGWPMFRADPAHTGNVAENTVVTPSLLWSYPIQSEPGGGISSPAVVNGVLYVGSPDGNLYALNATDGVKLWNYSTGAPIDSSPAVDDGIVYVGSLGFYALNATNGGKIWSFVNSGYVFSSPTVVDGVVYFGAGNIVYALNATSGSMIWKKSVSSSYWAIYSSPAVVDGVVYIGSDDHNVYALNATDGSQLWVYPTGLYVQSAPTVVNGIVYVISDDQNLYALNASNGQKLWNYNFILCSGYGASIAVANGVVYFLSGINGAIKAVNAETGKQLWSSNTTDCQPYPILVGGVLYVGGINNLFAFNATDGSWLWNSTQTGNILASPAYANGVVYVDSTNGNIYAFGTPLASSAQATPSPTSSKSSPTMSNAALPIIIYIACFLVVATAVFLMFRKRSKTKSTNQQYKQISPKI